MIDLYQGDCLDEMGKVADHTVDMIFTDLPYGTTKNAWDVPVPLDALWEQYRRVLKPGGAVLLFAQMPFGADLINSNRKWYRYEWIWHKTMPVGFLNAGRMPLRTHENTSYFTSTSRRIIHRIRRANRTLPSEARGLPTITDTLIAC